MNLDNSLNSVPDQIDSFIPSDTEPDATDFSHKNIKYQKIKDILLKDIKKDVCIKYQKIKDILLKDIKKDVYKMK